MRKYDRAVYLFNLYTEHIMRNAGLDELQAGIKIGGRNINILRYVSDTTLIAESKDQLKNLLMNMKEESEKIGLIMNNAIFLLGKNEGRRRRG